MTTSAAARMAAHTSWARTTDRTARTEAARTGLLDKFEREAREQLGPDATDAQVADAAESARQAHYNRMAVASAMKRRHGTTATP